MSVCDRLMLDLNSVIASCPWSRVSKATEGPRVGPWCDHIERPQFSCAGLVCYLIAASPHQSEHALRRAAWLTRRGLARQYVFPATIPHPAFVEPGQREIYPAGLAEARDGGLCSGHCSGGLGGGHDEGVSGGGGVGGGGHRWKGVVCPYIYIPSPPYVTHPPPLSTHTTIHAAMSALLIISVIPTTITSSSQLSCVQ